MHSPQKILIEIASASEKVVSTLDRYVGHKTVESFQLDKIVVGSNAVLETLNKTLLLGEGNIDDRLADWLGSDEPQACLHTLNQMERTLSKKHSAGRGGRSFFAELSFAPTTGKDASNEAIRLFQVHKSFFYFLLMPTDVWNSGHDTPRVPVHDDALCTNRTIGERSGARAHVMAEHAYSISQGEKMKKQEVNAEKLTNILGWLNAWKCNEIHKRTALLCQSGTCTWLLHINIFKTWKYANNSFLWLHGKAGAGKSVLVASMIENIKGTLKNGEILGFFYCDFRNKRSTSAAEVLRSILSQLIQQFCWNTIDHGDLMDELGRGRDEDTTISDVMLLARYICRVAEQFDQQPFIVIDALDECKNVEELLDALLELAKGRLRLFVTSRSLQVIRESFSAFPSISMDTMNYEVSVDIKLHIIRVLDSHRRLRIVDSNLKKEIYVTLSQKADGMFRWVQCQLDTLKRCMTAVRMREALNNLPSDLDVTYERILSKVDQVEEGEIVRRALEWLVAALEPLQLSQIMESLSINLNCGVLDHESRPVHGPALLDALGSLVMYDELTDIVILSHFTVKEYLTSVSTRTNHPLYHIDQQVAHTQLALLCMCYVAAYLKRSQHRSGYQTLSCDVDRTGTYCDDYVMATSHAVSCTGVSFPSPLSHPLLAYVLRHTFHHLAYTNLRSQAILRALTDLRSYAQQHPSEWVQLRLKSTSYIPWPTLKHDLVLYILTVFAPEPLLRLYLDSAPPKLKDGTNPLIYAAYHSRIEHCRTLLSRGLSLSRSGWDARYPRKLLPIEVAVEFGSCAVVGLFLKAESPVPQELFGRVLKRNRCTFPGSNVARLLQTDEFVEWAAANWDEKLLLRALNFARYYRRDGPSEQDIDIIQRRLIQMDCDPSTQFNEGSLRIAVSAGQTSSVRLMLSLNVPLPYDIILDASRNQKSNSEMIRLLLGVGSDVHVVSPYGDTALHIVLNFLRPEDQCLESAQLLVDAGCNPSACNLTGETPLHLAIMRGYITVSKYLLSLRIRLPPNILLIMPDLHTPSVIRLLMNLGSDVNAITADGDTPLHLLLRRPYAYSDECLEDVKILINAGCNPCLPNAIGETPFDVAVKNASPMIVQYFHSLGIPAPCDILSSVCGRAHPKMSAIIDFLIRKGANIHSTCADGDTLLHLSMNAASEEECLRRLVILVNAGCNPRACNFAGETLFHAAVRRGHISAMEYLLSIGISAPSDVMLALLGEHRLSPRCYPTIRFLLDKGADADVVGRNGMTLLHVAAGFDVEEDALEAVKLLVQSGCNPSAFNSMQETPLHVAVRHGHLTVIDYFLSQDMTFPPDVLFAALKGYSEKTQMIRYLIDKKADASSVVTADGDTPLHSLLANREEMDHLESAKILVGAGCDPHARNPAGETPFHIAARRGFITVLKYLLTLGVLVPRNILRTSAPATIRFFLGEGSSMSHVSVDDDAELLHHAVDIDYGYSAGTSGEQDCLECARVLVGLGWNPSLINSSGETPMHVVAKQGQISIVRYLLSQGVELPTDILLVAVTLITEAPWRADQTVQTTRFLINSGASVVVTAPNGDTPLHLALRCDGIRNPASYPLLRKRAWELVELFLEHAADPTVCNQDKQTPFDLAEAQGHFFKENFLRLVRNARDHLLTRASR